MRFFQQKEQLQRMMNMIIPCDGKSTGAIKRLLSLLVILILLFSIASAETAQRIKKITITEKSVTLAPGISHKLAVTVEPDDSTPDLIWTSSNEKIASVDSTGTITGIKKGNAKITATAADGGKAKASITVKVEEFDLVFASKKPQKLKYHYSGTGRARITGTVKNGNVSIPEIDIDMFTSVSGGPAANEVEVTPLHPGTDIVTINFNGKKIKYSIFIADYFEEHEIQYVELADTTPDIKNGTFQEIIYGTPYSEIEEQLQQQYGNSYDIREYEYGFQIKFNNPGIKVAGHAIKSITFEFCYDENSDGTITKEATKSCLYRGKYVFTEEPNDNIAENLHNKLNELYGKSHEDEHPQPEHLRDLLETTKYNWTHNDISITLDNTSSLYISYLWGKGFSKRQGLIEIINYQKELEEKKKNEAEQNQFSTSLDGL